MILIMSILAISSVFALSNPITNNGKTYYKVNSADPTEDTGAEVCAQAGMSCAGYTEPTSAVCKLFHPNAAETSGGSGDLAGVYCDGAPQSGECSLLTDSCLTCPACTNTVDCNTPIGGLYREMYVECAAGSCKLSISAADLNDLLNQVQGLNAQLQACPQTLPTGTGLVFADGNTVVDIVTNSGTTETLAVTIMNGQVTGIARGTTSTCKQTITVAENDVNTILKSSSPVQAIAYMVGQKTIKVSGCTFISSIRLAFTNPITAFIARRKAPTPPPPKPQPDCGQVGEQCNNRACWTGICGAPRENINGQWGYFNYRCIDQSEFNADCVGRGNAPPAWSCLTGPCR